jgi:hypothetical protein
MLTAAQIEQRRNAGRLGGLARKAKSDWIDHQRMARSHVSSESCARNGHKGAVVYGRKYGYAKLFALCRVWRLDHPSEPERQVMAILDSLRLTYEREALPLVDDEFTCVDFLSGFLVVEVNGKVHYDPAFDHPSAPGTRAASDARKLQKLRAAGFRVLVLDWERQKAEAAGLIADFVCGGHDE